MNIALLTFDFSIQQFPTFIFRNLEISKLLFIVSTKKEAWHLDLTHVQCFLIFIFAWMVRQIGWMVHCLLYFYIFYIYKIDINIFLFPRCSSTDMLIKIL